MMSIQLLLAITAVTYGYNKYVHFAQLGNYHTNKYSKIDILHAFDNKNVNDIRPQITRVYTPSERKPLKEYSVGQKIRGRIISVVHYGLFVDFGSSKDGLIHIKDISKDYFVSNLVTRFIPGQDIDVWIKFINYDEKKVGLQMYPFDTTDNSDDDEGIKQSFTALEDLSIKQELIGKAVKFSDYGVFFDIGAEVPAFMHKKKIRSNRRQRKYKPWEIISRGSKISVYIDSVDLERRRIGITSYHPDEWDNRCTPPSRIDRSDDDDDEELGGTTRAQNIRALERTLALDLNSNDNDNDDSYDEEFPHNSEAIVEDLSPSEIRKLTKESGRDVSKLLMMDNYDDIDGSSVSSEEEDDEDNELTSEELFEDLAQGRDWLYFKDIKEWDYVRHLLMDGEIEESQLRELFNQANPLRGRLDRDAFEDFVDVFVDTLGLEEIDYYSDDQGSVEQSATDSKQPLLLIDDMLEADDATDEPVVEDAVIKSSAEIIKDDDKSEEEWETNLTDEFSSPSVEVATSNTNPKLLRDLFLSVTNGDEKAIVDFDSILEWSMVNELLEKAQHVDGDAVKDDLRTAFEESLEESNSKEGMSLEAFGRFVPKLSTLENNYADSIPHPALQVKQAKSGEVATSSKLQVFDDDDGEEGEDELLENVFKSLSNGKAYLTIKDLLNWDFVYTLLGEGVLTEDSLIEKVKYHTISASRKISSKDVETADEAVAIAEAADALAKRNRLSVAGFDSFVDDLVTLYRDSGLEEDYLDEAVLEDDSDSATLSKEERIEMNGEMFAEDVAGSGSDALEIDAIETFEQLSGKRDHITLEDLKNWDILREVLPLESMSATDWEEVLEAAGVSDASEIDIFGFESILDEIVERSNDIDFDDSIE